MAYDICKLMTTGTLSKDPEMRYTPQGTAITKFTIYSSGCGVQETDDNGNKRNGNEFTEWEIWDKGAEIINQHAHKGSRIYVEGRKQTRKWQDRDTGQTRYKEQYTATEFVILDPKGNKVAEGRGGEPQAAAPSRPSAPARSSAPANRAASRPPARNVPQTIENDDDLPF